MPLPPILRMRFENNNRRTISIVIRRTTRHRWIFQNLQRYIGSQFVVYKRETDIVVLSFFTYYYSSCDIGYLLYDSVVCVLIPLVLIVTTGYHYRVDPLLDRLSSLNILFLKSSGNKTWFEDVIRNCLVWSLLSSRWARFQDTIVWVWFKNTLEDSLVLFFSIVG